MAASFSAAASLRSIPRVPGVRRAFSAISQDTKLSGDAKWTMKVPLPPNVKVDPMTGHLAPHQTIFSTWPQSADKSVEWNPMTRRVGVLAMKAGMTADWDMWGVRRAMTVLKLDDVIVTDVIKEEERGYSALQVGAGIPRPKELNSALLGHFEKLGVAPRSYLAEFRVTSDALLPIGTPLVAQHFMPGQFITVSGTSQGKGFQGAMKRHGFAGQGASHGNSVSHRVLGSTGNRQDPGKVIKGKKMPGQMGGVTITMDGLRIHKVDIKHNLLYVEGALPGKPGMSTSISRAPAHPSHNFPCRNLLACSRLAEASVPSSASISNLSTHGR